MIARGPYGVEKSLNHLGNPKFEKNREGGPIGPNCSDEKFRFFERFEEFGIIFCNKW